MDLGTGYCYAGVPLALYGHSHEGWLDVASLVLVACCPPWTPSDRRGGGGGAVLSGKR